MCLHPRRFCECGSRQAFLFYRDNLLPEEVLVSLYCPECRPQQPEDPECMLEDGGWLLEYDMDMARFFLAAVGAKRMDATPEWIFDEQYCGWYGLCPTDLADSLRMHEQLQPLKDRKRLREYMTRVKEMRVERVRRLKEEGWRRARDA